MDIYELLVAYCQMDFDIWKESGKYEKVAGMKTKEDWDSDLTAANKKLKDLFKGTDDMIHSSTRSRSFSLDSGKTIYTEVENRLITEVENIIRFIDKDQK